MNKEEKKNNKICNSCEYRIKALFTDFDEKSYSDGYAQATADANAAAESVNAENAKKAAKMIIKYCARFNVCGKHCIFYREGSAGCAIEFPYDYDIKEETGGKNENNN